MRPEPLAAATGRISATDQHRSPSGRLVTTMMRSPAPTGFTLGTFDSPSWDGRSGLMNVRTIKGSSIVTTGLVAAGGNVVRSAWGHLQACELATGRRAHRLGPP